MAKLSWGEVVEGMRGLTRPILAVAPDRREEVDYDYHDNGILLRNLLLIVEELGIQLPADVLDTVDSWIADRTQIRAAPGVDLTGAARIAANQRAALAA